jgi:aminobenzoyl-glutamate utilization protein B
MLHAAKALAATALDLITSAELLARAKIEWSENMDGQQHACPIPESVQSQAR